jgi:hypothetical protein
MFMRGFFMLLRPNERFARDLAVGCLGLGAASLLAFVAVASLQLGGGLQGRGVVLGLILPLVVLSLANWLGPMMTGAGLWMALLGPRRWGLALLAAGAAHVAAVRGFEWWLAGPRGLLGWS